MDVGEWPRNLELGQYALSFRDNEIVLALGAALTLARLGAEAGRRSEVHEMLAPLYGWFTEGFDTPDLVEAKALLDELS